MNLGSTFAGVGGFDLAADLAGIEVEWQSEIDPHASKVLEHHWPWVPNYGDIKEIDEHDLPRIDVLAGGFPCQDYSIAGSRFGLAGDRGALFHDLARVIAGTSPKWIVLENVVGLLTSRGGADFGYILDTLGELGYGITYRVLDSSGFGTPQRRRRVFVVGHSGGVARPEVLLEPESLSGDIEQGRQVWGTPPPPVGASPRFQRITSIARMTAFGKYVEDGTASTLKYRDYKDATDLIAGWNKDGSAFVRRLTPVECERLQGFPDDWTKMLPDAARYQTMGNAVCVPVVEWIMRRLVAAEEAA